MTPNLQNNVASPQDLKELILEVQKYAKWFSQYAIKQKVSGAAPAQQLEVTPPAAALIQDWTKDKPPTQASIDELIKALELIETNSPQITITLAAMPPVALKKTLVDWCRKNINPSVLVEFRFNSTLLGGMVLRYGSHIYDWSFRRQILSAGPHFPEVLRRV